MRYYPAYICLKGHEISTTSDYCQNTHCIICGQQVIHKCEECHTEIDGRSRDPNDFNLYYDIPKYCGKCGKPYPWTKLAVESAISVIDESELAFNEKQKLIEILPDAIAETPRTQLAIIRLQKAISGAGSFIADGLRQFAIDFGCELLKDKLGLS